MTVRSFVVAMLSLASIIPYCAGAASASPGGIAVNPLREAYYGDLHLHTSYSFDTILLGTTKVDPDTAYRFAKGEVVEYLGTPVQRREPLDFLAVTDHAENIGVLSDLDDPDSAVSRSELGQKLRALLASTMTADGQRDFAHAAVAPGEADPFDAVWRDYFGGRSNKWPESLHAASAAAWSREIAMANRNYQPGKFTAFIAYEWTSQPDASNLHRNVIFRGSSAPDPFTSFDSKNPQDLWNWLDSIRRQGHEALAIPHNGNASNGLMYNWVTAGEYMDRAYAEQRAANEPLSEIAQNKGASETHPLLSPNDEFADYEIFDFMEQYRREVGRPQGSYLRDALSAGLVLQRQLGANPFKYGFVGGSDLHSGLTVSAQADYAGSHWAVNLGAGRPTRSAVASVFAGDKASALVEINLKTEPSNLTGIWAESNTRESLYDALRRRETFATSGSKMKFRFFGGWALPQNLLQRRNWVAAAYAAGVPMGGDLPPHSGGTSSPLFAIWAIKDPNGANLDRVQVIKVWEDGGQQHEKVFDVVGSGNRHPDPVTAALPRVGDSVDLTTGTYRNDIGAVELKALWKDPHFDPSHAAAYYVRVLEIPTPRWPTLLASHYGLPIPHGTPAQEQQRGWSSPIWYTPVRP